MWKTKIYQNCHKFFYLKLMSFKIVTTICKKIRLGTRPNLVNLVRIHNSPTRSFHYYLSSHWLFAQCICLHISIYPACPVYSVSYVADPYKRHFGNVCGAVYWFATVHSILAGKQWQFRWLLTICSSMFLHMSMSLPTYLCVHTCISSPLSLSHCESL